MKAKTKGVAVFRPREEIADRLAVMDRLHLNKSGILNDVLTANLKQIDAKIEAAKAELRAYLEPATR